MSTFTSVCSFIIFVLCIVFFFKWKKEKDRVRNLERMMVDQQMSRPSAPPPPPQPAYHAPPPPPQPMYPPPPPQPYGQPRMYGGKYDIKLINDL